MDSAESGESEQGMVIKRDDVSLIGMTPYNRRIRAGEMPQRVWEIAEATALPAIDAGYRRVRMTVEVPIDRMAPVLWEVEDWEWATVLAPFDEHDRWPDDDGYIQGLEAS